MGLDLHGMLRTVISSVVYGIVGMMLFAVAFWIIARSLPFSLRKEIEDDQNVALGIMLGAVILGLAMIVSAAVHG